MYGCFNSENPYFTFSQFTNTPGALSMLLPGMQWLKDNGGGTRIKNTENASVLLSLDGMTVYKADHFFGLFSAINPDFIEKITIHRNNTQIHCIVSIQSHVHISINFQG